MSMQRIPLCLLRQASSPSVQVGGAGCCCCCCCGCQAYGTQPHSARAVSRRHSVKHHDIPLPCSRQPR